MWVEKEIADIVFNMFIEQEYKVLQNSVLTFHIKLICYIKFDLSFRLLDLKHFFFRLGYLDTCQNFSMNVNFCSCDYQIGVLEEMITQDR